ncbi:MAG: hypothetical protein IRY99_24300, partial [Isosphaeraceae bacterium]|nr:hypothetical protein [Isosphaeraceae bacterium]
MPTGHRSRAVLPLLILVALAPAGWADEERDARLARLRSMPRPQREALARNLETFDRLGPAEQAAIRDLDRRIAEADPVDRKRYYEVLRRYHLWLQTLTPEQRQALAAAPPDRRLDLIARYRAEQAKAPPRRETIDLVQIALSPLGLWQTALQLKIWFSITPAERKALEQIRAPDERAKQLRQYGK